LAEYGYDTPELSTLSHTALGISHLLFGIARTLIDCLASAVDEILEDLYESTDVLPAAPIMRFTHLFPKWIDSRQLPGNQVDLAETLAPLRARRAAAPTLEVDFLGFAVDSSELVSLNMHGEPKRSGRHPIDDIAIDQSSIISMMNDGTNPAQTITCQDVTQSRGLSLQVVDRKLIFPGAPLAPEIDVIIRKGCERGTEYTGRQGVIKIVTGDLASVSFGELTPLVDFYWTDLCVSRSLPSESTRERLDYAVLTNLNTASLNGTIVRVDRNGFKDESAERVNVIGDKMMNVKKSNLVHIEPPLPAIVVKYNYIEDASKVSNGDLDKLVNQFTTPMGHVNMTQREIKCFHRAMVSAARIDDATSTFYLGRRRSSIWTIGLIAPLPVIKKGAKLAKLRIRSENPCRYEVVLPVPGTF